MPKFTTSDGLNLDYSDTGTGIEVLCLPGLTRNRRDFEAVIKTLEKEARFIALTSRGRHGSDWDDDFMNYSVPIEARDAVELLDHLGIKKAVILGTSRGGIIAMFLASLLKERLAGVILNDIGPILETGGLHEIAERIGKNPPYQSYEEAAQKLPGSMKGFGAVPETRWREFAEHLYIETEDGLKINYDPKLRDAVLESFTADEQPDLWPFFDALEDIPLALIRGMNSDLLSHRTANEMQRRRPDMIHAEVPCRAHVPFLDEAESISAIRALLKKVSS